MLDLLQDILSRQWRDLLERPSGPLSFRFILQPVMAAILAIRDGAEDARTGRSPYFFTILTDPSLRGPRLREGLAATSKIIVAGLGMDAVYQFIAFRTFYPLEAAIIALGLAFLPYFLIRGPAERLARWRTARQRAHSAKLSGH